MCNQSEGESIIQYTNHLIEQNNDEIKSAESVILYKTNQRFRVLNKVKVNDKYYILLEEYNEWWVKKRDTIIWNDRGNC